jgi:hypothetical protein
MAHHYPLQSHPPLTAEEVPPPIATPLAAPHPPTVAQQVGHHAVPQPGYSTDKQRYGHRRYPSYSPSHRRDSPRRSVSSTRRRREHTPPNNTFRWTPSPLPRRWRSREERKAHYSQYYVHADLGRDHRRRRRSAYGSGERKTRGTPSSSSRCRTAPSRKAAKPCEVAAAAAKPSEAPAAAAAAAKPGEAAAAAAATAIFYALVNCFLMFLLLNYKEKLA